MEHTVNGNTLELAGSLDVRCTAELRAVVYRLLDRRDGDVHVDISRVDSVDLTTLKMLAVANRVAERQGCRVVLRGGSPAVRRLLHLSHLRWMIPVEPSDHSNAEGAAGAGPAPGVTHAAG